MGSPPSCQAPPLQGEVPVLQGVFALNTPSANQEVTVKHEDGPAVKPVIKPERPPEPVSKWTLADYDDDGNDADKFAPGRLPGLPCLRALTAKHAAA